LLRESRTCSFAGEMQIQSIRIEIRGVVQGVGFRPFVKRIADRTGVSGFVRNEGFGVVIVAQGEKSALDEFLRLLESEKPPAARYDRMDIAQVPSDSSLAGFKIVSSRESAEIGAMPPDLAVCEDCLREMFDPTNRRYLYPFINCTNCGPRFTIIRELPYDRPATTMAEFEMCPDCRAEYENPADRRYHAQPVACPVCGPEYFVHPEVETAPPEDIPRWAAPIWTAAKFLAEGKIVALEGIGGFHLMCDAANPEAVEKLRRWKRRPTKPFAVMVADISAARRIAKIYPDAEKILLSPAAPIVLLPAKDTPIKRLVAPTVDTVGVFMPYAPAHHLLFHFGAPKILVATSGNRRDEPIARDPEDAIARLDIADIVVWHNRKIHNRADDSVGFVLDGKFHTIRSARGLVPSGIEIKFSGGRKVLGAGADMKGGIAISNGEIIYPSQYLGDLADPLAQDFWRETVEKFLHWQKITPELVVCDLHPDYFSTRLGEQLAEKLGVPCARIQHHRAHCWSAAAEHGQTEPALCVAFDGTGLGDDGKIWGGEIFFLNPQTGECRRMAHLEEIVLPGGDSAAVKIARMGYAYLLRAFGSPDKIPDLPITRHLDKLEISAIAKIFEENRPPITTSVGRLFDAVAAICGVSFENEYEGAAPMTLEALAAKVGFNNILAQEPYPADFREEGGQIVFGVGGTIAAIVDDLKKGTPVGIISAKFHRTLAHLTARILRQLGAEFGTKDILFSGGVLQNKLLIQLFRAELGCEFNLKFPAKVPANDQGIAVGQALWGSLFGK